MTNLLKSVLLGWLGALILQMPVQAAPGDIPVAAPIFPAEIAAQSQILRDQQDGLWEKSLIVRFPSPRRALSTSLGFLDAQAVVNHAAHPDLWHRLGAGSEHYVATTGQKLAQHLQISASALTLVSTAADMDNLAMVTRQHGPLTVSVVATAGARTNAQRTGVDTGAYIEGVAEPPVGTINLIVLTNIELSDAALARALITITEGKTAALEDLQVMSSYTPGRQATGTGTDSIIVVSGTAAPRATYTGGHSRIGELIGKAAYEAVMTALGKQNGYFLPGKKRIARNLQAPPKSASNVRLALLHLDPIPGDIAGNRARIEAGIYEAVAQGADWVITPELAETGYNFAKRIGTGWIAPFPDAWVHTLAAIARDNGVALFIGLAERDAKTRRLHNSVAVIDRRGNIQGTYRKQRPVGGAEAWSVAGKPVNPFLIDDIPVGTLICADAWAREPAQDLASRGAAILLSPANWPPVEDMGPAISGSEDRRKPDCRLWW